MGTVQVDLGPDLVALLAEFERPLPELTRELVVLELYRQGVISSGRAADLLAMPRGEFIRYASARGIPYLQLSSDELRQEVEDSRSL